jgi:fatty-acyl-CoA synthase
MTTPRLRTVVQALEDAAASTTGYRFIEEGSDAEPFFSHGDIERASARYGGAMQALGAKRGDRVALILPDNADFVFAFLGALRAGVIPVPIYPPTGLGKLAGYLDNTLHIVSKSGASLLLTTSEIRRVLGTVQERAPDLRKIAEIEGIRRSSEELKPEKVALDDVCFLQFTSGSTSRPKGVTLTHENVAANVRSIMDLGLRVRPGSGDSGASWLPLYHDMGLIGFVIAPLYHQNSVTFLPPLLFLKRPARWLETVSRHRATVSFGPNFAYALCVKRIRESEMQNLDLSTWRVAGCGAEPIRADNLRAFAQKFGRCGFDERAFMACYGLAESTLAVSFHPGGVHTDRVRAESLRREGRAEQAPPDQEGGVADIVQCGRAFEGHEIGVFALDDAASEHPLAERRAGELRIKGPSTMTGYWNEPELTRNALAGGWLRTGDLGYIAGGEVHICGRAKEVIIVNGRNYYPQDLEWVAARVEGVRKGNVIAFGTMKPSHDRERVVVAFETSVSDPAERETLRGEVRRVLQQGVGLRVDDVVPLDVGVLPKTSSGKLQRARTRELYEQGALLDRASILEVDRVEVVKELTRSQISYFKLAIAQVFRRG